MRNLLRNVSVVLLTFVVFNSNAQEDPQYSQYMFNKLAYNPAVAGSEDVVDATLLLRNQWLGFTDGTPVTQNLLVHMPVNKLHGGLGFQIVNDLIGVESNTQFMVSYAYSTNIKNVGNLSIGLTAGITQSSLDGSKLIAPDGRQDDPGIPFAPVSGVKPDIGLGVYFTRHNLFAGLSSTHLIEPTVTYNVGGSNVDVKQIRHYYMTAGYNIEASSKVDVVPSTMIKSDLTKTQVDLNALLFYNKNLWTGLSYRGLTNDNRDAVVVLAGLNLTNQLRLGYSFDVTTSKIRSFSSGTHEFMLNYKFIVSGPKKPGRIIHCPRFL